MVANAALDPSRPTGLNATVAVNPALPGAGRSRPDSRWRRFLAAVPLRCALLATTAVWAMGCVWSFREQALFAAAKGFAVPWLLPAVIDGLAIALACVAYAASLDGRPGTIARLGTAVAVAASAASNATFAWQRSGDRTAVVIAAGVPIAANLAFEVLLHELRRRTLRRRGLPAPAAVPYPRLIRVVLAPCATLRQWRRLVLELTALEPAFVAATTARHPKASDASEPCSGASTHPAADAPARRGPDASASALPIDPLAPTGANRTSADTPPPVRADAQPLPSHPQSPQLIPADSRQPLGTGARHAAHSGMRQVADADADVRADADAGTPDRPPRHQPGSARRLRVSGAGTADPGRSQPPSDAAAVGEEARQLYRSSVAAGQPLTGRQLGSRYGRSASWGRERIGEVKAHNRRQPGGVVATPTHLRERPHPDREERQPVPQADSASFADRGLHVA